MWYKSSFYYNSFQLLDGKSISAVAQMIPSPSPNGTINGKLAVKATIRFNLVWIRECTFMRYELHPPDVGGTRPVRIKPVSMMNVPQLPWLKEHVLCIVNLLHVFYRSHCFLKVWLLNTLQRLIIALNAFWGWGEGIRWNIFRRRYYRKIAGMFHFDILTSH